MQQRDIRWIGAHRVANLAPELSHHVRLGNLTREQAENVVAPTCGSLENHTAQMIPGATRAGGDHEPSVELSVPGVVDYLEQIEIDEKARRKRDGCGALVPNPKDVQHVVRQVLSVERLLLNAKAHWPL